MSPTRPLDVLLLLNTPTLASEHPDRASEAGVLESVDAISRALKAAGHRVQTFEVEAANPALLRRLADAPRVDVVFNLFEGFNGRGEGEAQVASVVELLGLPMTGSEAKTLAIVRDKPRTKWLLAGAGLPTPEFFLVEPGDSPSEASCASLFARGPAIIKPAYEDASLGVSSASVVHDSRALLRQVEEIHRRFGGALVERFVAGREFNVGVIALPEPELLPLAEIEFAAAAPAEERLVTYDAKWCAGGAADLATPVRCPARVEAALAAEIGRVALAAFRVTGCRHYARVDLRVDEQGAVAILEVNGNPDLGPQAGLARALQVAGHEYDPFIDRLVRHVWQSSQRGAFADRS